MTRQACILTTMLALVLASGVSRADDKKSCVPEDLPELVPVIPDRIEHAAEQAKLCADIVSVGAANANCGAVQPVQAAIAFCNAPLNLSTPAPTPAQLKSADDLANDPNCGVVAAAVTVQALPDLPSTSLQNDIIRGIAQFVVARAKAEAMAFLITRVHNKVCGNADGKGLLPKTCAFVDDSKPEDGAPMAWGTVRAAFEADLQRFPARAMACVATKAEASEDTSAFLVGSVQAVQLVLHGSDPRAVLAGLTDRFAAPDCKTNRLQCAIHMLGYAVRTVSPTLDSNGDPDAIDDAVLYAKLAARRMFDRAKDRKLISAATSAELDTLRDKLVKLYALLDTLRLHIKSAKTDLGTVKTDVEKLKILGRLAGEVVTFVKATKELVPDDLFGTAPDGKTSKKTWVTKILSTLEDFRDAVSAIQDQNYSRAFVLVGGAIALLHASGIVDKLPSSLAKFGPFISDVASAKSADDVQKALETAATPVGGGLAKRGSGHRTFAINAFLGIQGGEEFTEAPDGDNKWAAHGGLFVPVGFDFSVGVCDDLSLGAFVSVIDVGAVTSLRQETKLDNDQKIETTPEVGFEQVLSPGAYFVLGIDRFAIGAGVSMTPNLRRITFGNTVVEEAPALRFGIFAAIDVTIFPF